jgi:hypothetical protein
MDRRRPRDRPLEKRAFFIPLFFMAGARETPTSRSDKPSKDIFMERENAQSRQPIRFAGSELGSKRHICGFFRNPEEEYRLLLPFIKDGFVRGEKAFHVVDPKLREDHLRRLEAEGIDVIEAEKSSQFEFCDWDQAYFPDGRFDQDRMLAMWREVLDAAGQRGFPLTRLVAHMEWALEEREGVSDLLEYEARFTRFIIAPETRSSAPTISPNSEAIC